MVINLREIKKRRKNKKKTRVHVCESMSVIIAMKVRKVMNDILGLIVHFEHTFEHLKQHYIYFHIFLSTVYQKYPNNITQTSLPNTILELWFSVFSFNK